VSVGRISAEELLRRVDSATAPVILDVRSRSEFASGHVPGARHIPFWRISRRIGELSLPRDAELVVYCGHGPRAVIAGRALRRNGFTRITYLEGHFSKWRNAGLREEKGPR
jgi:rhodanese-related sulfurtransferase